MAPLIWLSTHVTDELEYVQDRLLAAAMDHDQAGNADAAAASRMYVKEAAKHHSANPGGRTAVAAGTPLVCAEDGQPFPCGFLKALAQPWRDKDNFPKHLL